MIGTKKLSTIRQELASALSVGDTDPIAQLERQINTAKKKGDRTEVLEGLKHFLESPPKRNRRRPRTRSEK